MCRLLKVSRSAYCSLNKLAYYTGRQESLDKKIVSVFEDIRCTYGSPRIAKDLAVKGTIISKSTIARRMNDLNIKARSKRTIN